MLDLIRPETTAASDPDEEAFSPREIRLLRRVVDWVKAARPDRLRAMETLVEDLLTAAAKAAEERVRQGRRGTVGSPRQALPGSS